MKYFYCTSVGLQEVGVIPNTKQDLSHNSSAICFHRNCAWRLPKLRPQQEHAATQISWRSLISAAAVCNHFPAPQPTSHIWLWACLCERNYFVTHCHQTSSKHPVLGNTLCSQPADFNRESQPKFSKSHKCRFNSTYRSNLREIN